jgi:hypothetical protein
MRLATPTLACHPRHSTQPFHTLPDIASALLRNLARRSAVVRCKAVCRIAADNLLTGPGPSL